MVMRLLISTQVARTSSPASMSAQKRTYGPPLLRSNVNRSTSSLLGHSTPPRRSVSPLARQTDGTTLSDLARRYGPASMSSSPARSTLSFVSTANPYQVAPAASTNTTPGKPSPLYYDYTEDFDIDDYNKPAVLESPPHFRVDKTIPEDRPLSATWQNNIDADAYETKAQFSSSARSTVIDLGGVKSSLGYSHATIHSDHLHQLKQQEDRYRELQNSEEGASTCEKNVERLSDVGFGAQELGRSVGEAFGLASTPSLELSSAHVLRDTDFNESRLSPPNSEIMESASLRTSGYSFNTHLKQFPPPPKDNNRFTGDSEEASRSRISSDTFGGRGNNPHTLHKTSPSSSLKRIVTNGGADNSFQIQSQTETNDRIRTSQFLAPDANGEEITDLSLKREIWEEPDTVQSSQPLVSDLLSASASTSSLSTVPCQLATSTQLRVAFTNQSGSQAGNESTEIISDTLSTVSRYLNKKKRLHVVTEPAYGETKGPNISHQVPRRLSTRSDSPILAPKPISPARQLKLKNSIPQLMKALPAVPAHTEKSICAMLPIVQPIQSQNETLYSEYSPLTQKVKSDIPLVILQENVNHSPSSAQSNFNSGAAEVDSRPIVSVSTTLAAKPEPSSQPTKFKLKMRSSASLRPISTESRPWNRDDSYPWSDSDIDAAIRIKPINGENSVSNKQPRFKLKVVRASNSTLGTVRVNRESSDSRSRNELRLRNPKDLFTTTSGMENIFSTIKQRLHSRKSSNASNGLSIGSEFMAFPSHNLNLEPIQKHSDQLTNAERITTSIDAPGSTQTASWFTQDSIHSHERLNLRKRISNLRSRMITPYASKNPAQSYDDLTWRTQNRAHAPSPSPTRSNPDLHTMCMSTETERKKGIIGKNRILHWRSRVSEWLKIAKLGFAAHAKRGSHH